MSATSSTSSDTSSAPAGFDQAAFEAFLKTRDDPGWVMDRRRQAFALYQEKLTQPLDPEEWKRIDIRGLKPSQFALRGSADDVRLYFNQGKGLPDPEKLLQGSAGVRWIPVESASTLTRPAVVHLFDEALARSRVPFAATGRGPLVVRLTSAKKRQRT